MNDEEKMMLEDENKELTQKIGCDSKVSVEIAFYE